MPPFGPIKRNDFIRTLRKAGFKGPYAGGKHEFMVKDELRFVLPNPHRGEISKDLLRRLLRQIHLSVEEWEKL